MERCDDLIKGRVAPLLARLPVRVAISVFAVVLVALSCVSVAVYHESGFTVSELAPSGSSMERALEVLFDHFQTFPAKICFFELDVPANQRKMLDLYHAVTTSPHAAPFDVPPYLTMFSFYVLPLALQAYPGAAANETYADMGWTLDDTWTHPQWAPFGTVNSDRAKFYEIWHKWSKMPLDNPALAFQDPSFVTADLAFSNEFAYAGGAGSDLKYSYFMFYQTKLFGQSTYLDSIKEVRDAFSTSGLSSEKAFPWGATFSFWSIYLELESIMLRLLVTDLIVIFLLTLVVVRSFASALASTLACGMVVMVVYGVVTTFSKFNFFLVANLLVAAGISVEFSSHLIVSFNLLDGPLRERLGEAMSHTSPPLLQGAISTFLSMLPLGFADIKFMMKYFFASIGVLVAVGMLAGFVLLPAFLALFSPISDALSRMSHRGSARAEPPAVQEGHVHGSPSEQLPTLMPDPHAPSGDSRLRKRSKEQVP